MKILAIPGSLRKSSVNKTLLKAAALLAPQGVEITLYEGVGGLSHFNPDLESDEPTVITELKKKLGESDALLISSPEYAHGVPGSLKNALDWLVGGREMVGKPVALWNASPRATYAQASLRETLVTMSARVIQEASIEIPILGKSMSEAEIAFQAAFSKRLINAIDVLKRTAQTETIT